MKISEIREKLSGRAPGIIGLGKVNAVLIPLVEKEGKLFLLFEKRASEIPQGGEVCFPGGRVNKGEKPQRAILREVEEELGLAPHQVTLFGEFDLLHNYTDVTIHTFVGQIANIDVENMVPQENEVAEIFLIPIDFLLENNPFIYEYSVVADIKDDFPYHLVDSEHKYTWLKGSCNVPIWNYEGYCLWGITARIVRHFLEIFFSE